jgi:hypothetical protein
MAQAEGAPERLSAERRVPVVQSHIDGTTTMATD